MPISVLACSERILEKVMGPPQRGLVHSAFASAANLSFADGFLLSLNASSYPLPPGSLAEKREVEARGQYSRVSTSLFSSPQRETLLLMPNGLLLSAYGGTFPFTALKTGMPVVIGAGWLALEALSYSLDCTSCPRWNPRIEPPESLSMALLRDNARLVAQLCQSHQPPQSDELLAYGNGETLQMLAEKLCGRGPGLTPSGDDFLAGCMAVGWLLYGPQADFLASCQRVKELASQRTHALSQCWLAYAAAGDVAYPIGALLAALTIHDHAQLERATTQVLALGASSGYDLLQGILYGIAHFPML